MAVPAAGLSDDREFFIPLNSLDPAKDEPIAVASGYFLTKSSVLEIGTPWRAFLSAFAEA